MIINGTDLRMIRGDSESITLTIVDENNFPYEFQDGDIVFFTVKTRARTTEPDIQKEVTVFPDNKAVIEILPEDTKGLSFRSYVYDIQLTQKNGRVKTVIPSSTFEILEEVTHV